MADHLFRFDDAASARPRYRLSAAFSSDRRAVTINSRAPLNARGFVKGSFHGSLLTLHGRRNGRGEFMPFASRCDRNAYAREYVSATFLRVHDVVGYSESFMSVVYIRCWTYGGFRQISN